MTYKKYVAFVLCALSLGLPSVAALAEETSTAEGHDEHFEPLEDDEISGAAASHQEQAHHEHTHHSMPQQHHAHAQAPIGVMGAHMHSAGHSMISLRWMAQDMHGMLDGSTAVSEMEAMQDFHMLPRSMTMLMPMLGAMFAPRDDLTLMLMAPGHWMQMEHVHHGESMQMSAVGLGDLSLTALLGNWQYHGHRLHLNLGLALPMGAIDIADEQQILPYSMRLGSGTWDLFPGLTYSGHVGALSWGLQPQATLRLGHNALGYRLGHRFQTNVWGAWQFLPWLQSSLRLNYQLWDNVDGADQRLAEVMHTQPGADPSRQAGQRLDLLLGMSVNGTPSFFPGHRLGLEAGLPLYQSLAGPQLANRWSALLGWEWQF